MNESWIFLKIDVGPVFNAYTWGLQVCYCISSACQPLAGACCLGQETIKKCVVCVFVYEAHFDTNCWKNNRHFTEKSRFGCLIMQTYVWSNFMPVLRIAFKIICFFVFFSLFVYFFCFWFFSFRQLNPNAWTQSRF